jgi:hypothetical protein
MRWKMKVSLITPTGGRPLAFSICERWMARQTKIWDEWYVLDDCDPATPLTLGQRSIRPSWRWEKGMDTQRENVCELLDAVTGDIIFFIEDDDWYHPNYIKKMCKLAEVTGANAVGEAFSRHYHILSRCYYQFPNTEYSPLCSTVITRENIPNMIKACQIKETPIDGTFWCNFSKGALIKGDLVLGIKGLPGRQASSAWHNESGRDVAKMKYFGASVDNYGTILRDWIGERDAKVYEQIQCKEDGGGRVPVRQQEGEREVSVPESKDGE